MIETDTFESRALRRALVVNRDTAIRIELRSQLDRLGFVIEEGIDGRDAATRAQTRAFGLIVLDLMMQNLDGITLCRTLRTNSINRDAPIVLLVPRDAEADAVLGLESGADDCVKTPFEIGELVARIRAVIRRSRASSESAYEEGGGGAAGPNTAGVAVAERGGRGLQAAMKDVRSVVEADGLKLDPMRRMAVVRGQRVRLTRQEFELLYLLASRPGIVFSRAALLSRVWWDGAFVAERTVDTVVNRLRRKVELNARHPALIVTTYGLGYKYADIESH
jgi:two-component system OmpR family response regulator